MTRRAVNASLLAAVAVLVTTGIAGWTLPLDVAAPLFPVHRVAGLALVLGLVWKYGIAARSLRARFGGRRGRRSVALGLSAASALLTCLALGVAWSIGAVSFDRPIPYSPLNLHVFAGLALLPLVVAHSLLRARVNAAGPVADRRAVVRGLGLFALAAVAAAAIDLVAPSRRSTGSKHAGSFSGNDFPLTIWQLDSVPELSRAAWRLDIVGRVGRPTRLGYDEITASPQAEVDAVLDCTGGWWSEQRWRGADLGALLERAGLATDASAIDVVSVTGHRWSFAPAELRAAVLATHVGGEELSAGHGAPARLVVPGRRGFQWVKWVARLEVS